MRLAKNTSKQSNHNFFSTWNENSAYMMGLLEADGCIENNKKITYSAAEKKIKIMYIKHTNYLIQT